MPDPDANVRIGPLAAKSIVTAANYGKPQGADPAVTLRNPGGTAMHRVVLHLAVFVLDIHIVALCCATFRI
jgi:hypothetical protein